MIKINKKMSILLNIGLLFYFYCFPTISIASPVLMQELSCAARHIQHHMDILYPDQFRLTIPEDNALKVIAEFVTPYGWWKGCYNHLEFDFSSTNIHNNEGPRVTIIASPPVAHRYDKELCLVQLSPHSAYQYYWRTSPHKKYDSYNFDRVQQMINAISFLIMDIDFFEEGEGANFFSKEEVNKEDLDSLLQTVAKIIIKTNLIANREPTLKNSFQLECDEDVVYKNLQATFSHIESKQWNETRVTKKDTIQKLADGCGNDYVGKLPTCQNHRHLHTLFTEDKTEIIARHTYTCKKEEIIEATSCSPIVIACDGAWEQYKQQKFRFAAKQSSNHLPQAHPFNETLLRLESRRGSFIFQQTDGNPFAQLKDAKDQIKTLNRQSRNRYKIVPFPPTGWAICEKDKLILTTQNKPFKKEALDSVKERALIAKRDTGKTYSIIPYMDGWALITESAIVQQPDSLSTTSNKLVSTIKELSPLERNSSSDPLRTHTLNLETGAVEATSGYRSRLLQSSYNKHTPPSDHITDSAHLFFNNEFFYPITLTPKSFILEFNISSIRIKEFYSYHKLSSILEKSIMQKGWQISGCEELGTIFINNEEITSDEELTNAIHYLQNDIKKKNKHRKNIDKLACIFTVIILKNKKWYYNVALKPTKSMAKDSNSAQQFELRLSDESPIKTGLRTNGRQWGQVANAWLPVMSRDMSQPEKLAIIKLLVDFSHKHLKLPREKQEITATRGNSIILKSLIMKITKSLSEDGSWYPTQFFLDLIINTVNTHYEVGELFAHIKHKDLTCFLQCLSGNLNRENLKDFSFLINYLIAHWARIANYADQPTLNSIRPRLVMNAFIEYLVRVMEREAFDQSTFSEKGLDDQNSLTIDTIINTSKTGFSVAVHQLIIFDFLLLRTNCLDPLTEHERDQLQIRVKQLRDILTQDSNYYASFMMLMFPTAQHWPLPLSFESKEHRDQLLQTVLKKFHARKGSKAKQSDLPGSYLEPAIGETFAVTVAGEHRELVQSLTEQLEALRPCKNIPVDIDGAQRYQQSCHYCGKQYNTADPLPSVHKEYKKRRESQGHMYSYGRPSHPDCREQRKADSQQALQLMQHIEINSPPPKEVLR